MDDKQAQTPYPDICGLIQLMLIYIPPSCYTFTPFANFDWDQNANDVHVINERLEGFEDDEALINYLNNETEILQTSGREIDHSRYLGGIATDDEGRIISAKAVKLTYLISTRSSVGHKAGLRNELQPLIANLTTPLNSELLSVIGIREEVYSSMLTDGSKISYGCVLVFVYLVATFSRFNSVEQRIGLSLCGVVSYALSLPTIEVLSQTFGIPFNPMHMLNLFLLLGIGVDDMFVILHAVNSIKPEERER